MGEIYMKLEDGEPVFVLRGRDKLAPPVISQWIDEAVCHGVNREKVEDAMEILERFKNYQPKKLPD